MTRFSGLIKTIVCICFIACAVSAVGQRTTRRNLKTVPPSTVKAATAAYDTIATAADSTAITFSGYEKTLRSTKESFFATNRTDSAITNLNIVITYKDMKGRTLDCRKVSVDIEIPTGETRRIDIRSWDRQKVFYYHLSSPPKAAQATPYRIKIALDAALHKK